MDRYLDMFAQEVKVGDYCFVNRQRELQAGQIVRLFVGKDAGWGGKAYKATVKCVGSSGPVWACYAFELDKLCVVPKESLPDFVLDALEVAGFGEQKEKDLHYKEFQKRLEERRDNRPKRD